MALQKRVSELPAVTTVAGTDLLIVSSNSATKRTSVQQIGAYFAANGVAGPQGPAGPAGAPGATNYTQLTNVPSTFPPSAHGHTIADVIGLQTALDGKQASGSYATLVGGKVPESQLPPIVTTWEGLTGKPSTFPPSTHSHVIADVTGLQTAIDGKAASSHTHTISNVTGLQTALDAKATPADVTTAVASVVNAAPASLDTLKELADALGNDANFASTVTNAIAGKAAAVHTHVIGDVTGLQTALDGKQASGSYAASVHTHGISDVTGLQTALDGKQAAGSYAAATHGHSISDVTGLQTALDGKSGVSHTHTALQVSGLATVATSGSYADLTNKPTIPSVSSRIVYASRAGCALNSNINSGGGTDDTAAMQAILDIAQDGLPLEVIVDGVARVSTLRVWRNTTIRCLPGAGFFQTAGANWHMLTTGYNLPTEPSHDNIQLLGGVWNCNGNNQDRWENADSSSGREWNFGLWIGWAKNFVARDVVVRNARTFSWVLMQSEDIWIENCRSIWDDGGDGGIGENRDGLHFWGSVRNVTVKNFWCNGDDDVLAFNTDENITYPDPRRGTTGGYIRNVLVDGCHFANATNGVRFIGYETPQPVVDNIFLRHIYGRITTVPLAFNGVNAGLISIDGWHVSGQNAINLTANEVHLNNIRRGTPINVTANLTLGNGFLTNQGWIGSGVGGADSEYESSAPPPPPPSSSVVLLHMDGSNGSTTFTDSGPGAVAVTANGNAQISTAQSKFGGASGYFNGTAGTAISFADLGLGTGNYTIELFFRCSSQTQYAQLIGNESTASTTTGFTVLFSNSTAGSLGMYHAGGLVFETAGGLGDNAWHHLAIVRSSGAISVYIDGVSAATGSDTASMTDGDWYVGGNAVFGGRQYDGYVDELRVTPGTAVYTANFTPPTAAFS
jgi:hypothetical protein